MSFDMRPYLELDRVQYDVVTRPADFIVRKYKDEYLAIDGKTGRIAYGPDPNASEVLEALLTNPDAYHILVKKITIPLTKIIVTEGEKHLDFGGSVLKPAGDYQLRLAGDKNIVKNLVIDASAVEMTIAPLVADASVNPSLVRLEDVTIKGGYRGFTYYDVGDCGQFIAKNVRTENTVHEGIYPSPGTGYTIQKVIMENIYTKSSSEDNGIDVRHALEAKLSVIVVDDCKGIYMDDVQNVEMSVLRVINPKNAPSLSINNAKNVSVENAIINGYTGSDSVNDTIRLYNCQNVKFKNVIEDGNGAYSGMAIVDSQRCVFMNCEFKNNADWGVREVTSTTPPDYNVFLNCYFENNGLGNFNLVGEHNLIINAHDDIMFWLMTVTEVYRDDYGGGFANFTPPTPKRAGHMFFAEDTNSTSPGKRLYVSLDGSTWSYVDLT